jgi:CRP-like cAMP-binding protein
MPDAPLDRLLAESKIFALLDEEGRKRLRAIAVEQTVAPGTALIREGDEGDAFYMLLDGRLTVDAESFTEDQQRVAVLTDGAVFGEIGALTHEPRTATVTAETEARVLRFEMVSVFGVLKDYPDALAGLKRLGLARSEELLEKLS